MARRLLLSLLVALPLASCADATAPEADAFDPYPQLAIDPATLCCADEWTSVGTFSSVVEQSESAVYAGLGTSSLSWGTGNPSSLSLEDVTVPAAAGGSYPSSGKLLTATFANGAIWAGTGVDGGELVVELEGCSVDASGACVPDGSVEAAVIPFTVKNTPNTGDPVASSDALILTETDPQIALWVEEGLSEGFEIYYQVRSPLKIVYVAALGENGFVSVGTDPVPVAQVPVDIHPGSDDNPVNLRSRGLTPVALLGSDALDVAEVDAASLVFGPGGAAPARVTSEDVDGDGRGDLVLHVPTQETGIACGDTFAALRGRLLDGRHLAGRDALRTVGCRG